MDWEKISDELNRPLDSRHVKSPPQGKYGEYVEAVHVIYEANRIFGFNGWSYAVTQLCKTNEIQDDGKLHVGYTAMVRLTVGDVSREDVGHGQGHHRSAGEAHDSAVKEAVTDALKRCLRTFGSPFGLALYDKSKANVQDLAAEERRANLIAESNTKLEVAIDGPSLQQARNEVMAAWGNNPPPEVVATFQTQLQKIKQESEAA